MAPRPRVKICCIASEAEVDLAVGAGASALGLVSWMPSGPGVLSDAQVRRLAGYAPPGVATFLLTCRQDAAGIIAHQRSTGASTLQLVDRLETGTHAEIREALPGIKLVQVVHVLDEASVDEALALAPQVDALLLDSGNPSLAVKELGGTGRRHDWSLSRRIREQAGVPVFLAGGLGPDLVCRAVEAVEPFGLDVCSGLRTHGTLDPAKVEAFFRQLESL